MKTHPIQSKKSLSAPLAPEIPVLFLRDGTCALGALVSLLWSGEKFHTCLMQEADHENPGFLKLNSLGEVPLLYRDGAVITENTAILPSIADLALGQPLTFAPGSRERDQLNRALGFLASDFHQAFGTLFSIESFHPEKKVQAQIRRRVVQGRLKEVIQHLEGSMLSKPFIFDSPTIADAYLFAMARWATDLYDVAEQFPKLKRFQTALGKDPSVKLALQIEKGRKTVANGNYLGNLDFKSFISEAATRHERIRQERHGATVSMKGPGLRTDLDPERASDRIRIEA